MNLHKNREIDALDNYLKKKLKSSLEHKHPPSELKARIIKAAARGSTTKTRDISLFISMAQRENYYDQISIERLRMATAFSLRIDAVGLY